MSLLVVTLMFAILSDFLLELFSIRISLCTGRLQVWMFDRFGQSPLVDFFFFIIFQFFSLKKNRFFPQISSLVNVGSFTRRQTFLLAIGSLCGFGLSSVFLFAGPWILGFCLCFSGFILSLLTSKDQVRDFAYSGFALGLFVIAATLFNEYLQTTTYAIFQYSLGPLFGLGVLLATTLFFRTSVAFIIFLSLFHHYIGINIVWLPILFFAHNSLLALGFVWQIIGGKRRLSFLLAMVLLTLLSQLGLGLFVSLYQPGLVSGLATTIGTTDFIDVFRTVVVYYGLFNLLPLIVVGPLGFLFSKIGLFDESKIKKSDSQKIINLEGRGGCFSIHLSMLLLRQEFKKYTTSVHTIFKIGRESDGEQEEINKKFVRYQKILSRVGDEIKELCFNIGRQRSYRWQVKEVMGCYRYVNQLELLVDDLSVIAQLLRKEGLPEEWVKDCRYWMGLQLMIFESFFDQIVGVERDEASREQVELNVKKSFEVLGRLGGQQSVEVGDSASQTLYRITESVSHLAR